MLANRLNALLLVLLLMTAPGCSKTEQTADAIPAKDGTVEQILKRGVLRVGFSTFVPWAMQDKQGEFIGFEIDVARRLAKDMGVQVQFAPTQWSGIIPALLSSKFDIIIGGMGIQPQRGLKVNFTIPYEYPACPLLRTRPRLAVTRPWPTSTGPTWFSPSGRAPRPWMPRRSTCPRPRCGSSSGGATIQEVLSGRAHAVVASDPFPAFQALKYPDKLVLPLAEPFTKEPIAFAVRKGDPDFVNFLDGWIRMVNDEGWLAERHRYWFRTDQWKSRVE
jgi:polar amino acid transport system substrate-binding protein